MSYNDIEYLKKFNLLGVYKKIRKALRTAKVPIKVINAFFDNRILEGNEKSKFQKHNAEKIRQIFWNDVRLNFTGGF